MNNEPYISVIVTCYNLENYIGEALKSVIDQDYNPGSFEIIVVDDCSTDRSPEIIKSFQQVRYIKTPHNQGVLLATLLGIQHAKGEVLAFLDGDDIWRSDKLSRIAARFSNDQSLIFLTHNYSFVDEVGKIISGLEYTQEIYRGIKDPDQVSRLIRDGILLRKNYVWLGSAYAIRLTPRDLSNFIDWTNSLPNPQLTYQDWTLAFWIAASCSGRFGYDSEKLFFYRIHSSNYSGDSKSLEKSIRNWSKSYYTSLAILDIAERFSCDEKVKQVCRSAVIKDKMILNLFQQPEQFSIVEFLRNWWCFGSFRLGFKELIRVLVIKIFGINIYFFLKKRF